MKKGKKEVSHLKTGSEILDLLVENKVPHIVEHTNTTTRVELESGQVFIVNDNSISLNDLSLINEVKKGAEKLKIENTNISPSDISFFQWGNIREGKYKGYIEVDVNSAYWEIAFKKGYIQEKTYLRGLNKIEGKKKIKKQARLIALGSMATVKDRDI